MEYARGLFSRSATSTRCTHPCRGAASEAPQTVDLGTTFSSVSGFMHMVIVDLVTQKKNQRTDQCPTAEPACRFHIPSAENSVNSADELVAGDPSDMGHWYSETRRSEANGSIPRIPSIVPE